MTKIPQYIPTPKIELLTSETIEIFSKIDEWIETNFPNLQDKKWIFDVEGSSSPTFIIGQQIVAKIYVAKWELAKINWNVKHATPKPKVLKILNQNKYVPKTISYLENDKKLNAPILIQEYLKGSTPLSKTFSSYNKVKQRDTLKKFIKTVRSFHNSKTKFSNKISTYKYLRNYLGEIENTLHLLTQKELRFFNSLASSYQSRIVSDKLVLTHRDLQFGNVLEKDNRLYLIDLDSTSFGLPFDEIESLFVYCFLWSDDYVPLPPKIELFEEIIKLYPELMDLKYKDEINLLIGNVILRHLRVPWLRSSVDFALKYFYGFEV
jgi:thiamine kinase-like enzyme